MRRTLAALAFSLALALCACSGGDKESFRNVDHDKSGKISFEELLFVFPDVTTEKFKRFDADGDGLLSEEEYAAFLKGEASPTPTPEKAGKPAPSPVPGPAPAETNQPSVPLKGEDVIEIPAPPAEVQKSKPEKGRKGAAKTEAAKKGAATQYTVAKGDTLTKIAQKFGVSVEDITKANGNMSPDTLRDGQVLTIPAR